MKEGFIKIASAVPVVRIADCTYNVQSIVDMMSSASDEGASVVVFPELSITGATCGDLFAQHYFIRQAESALDDILSLTHTMQIVGVVGMPVLVDDTLFNCAVVISEGEIKCVVPKLSFGNDVRWFVSGNQTERSETVLCGQRVPFGFDNLFVVGDITCGIEIGEDINQIITPSAYQSLSGANVVIGMASDYEAVGLYEQKRQQIANLSQQLRCAYVYTSSGYGESTTDNVYGGRSVIAECGEILSESKRFEMSNTIAYADVDVLRIKAIRQRSRIQNNTDQEYNRVEIIQQPSKFHLSRTFNPLPFVPQGEDKDQKFSEIFNIQINALAQRLTVSRSKCAIIGISGGLDSTLALLVSVRAIDRLGLPRTNVIGVTMPGFGTTGRTYNNAMNLMKALKITIKEISIKDACTQHFNDIGLSPDDRSVTYENAQARERTQILMDLANIVNGLVVGTGDLSEFALGWATYNGDHMSMYGVNASVSKTLVRELVRWVAADGIDEAARPALLDIVDTPISPELLPADSEGNIAQKTEDLVGPYELHDFFLYNMLLYGFSPSRLFYMAHHTFAGQYSDAVIKKWLTTFLRRFFNQQFKRSCCPDGPQVGPVSLSPRGAWLMPSDAQSKMWLDDAENVE
ncbi:MAG: NAD(+) synthase [Bacteroidales bacterium]|nr:NAD(+) synthase [Bacteroidales bacterium]